MTSVRLCKEFEEIAMNKNIVLSQGDKHPLFIVGEFYNIDKRKMLGRSFFEIDTGCDRTLLSRKVCKDMNLKVETVFQRK